MGPVLYDAVTLRHFAAVSRMDILKNRHEHRPKPRWTKGVQKEIAGAAAQTAHCAAILRESWLGTPEDPTQAETRKIYWLQTVLMMPEDPSNAHLGEAQSIYFAEKFRGQFATDDNAAYNFARQRSSLGSENVIDSVDILREAVALHEITASDADQIAIEIEAAGRSLRRVHNKQRGPGYFSM